MSESGLPGVTPEALIGRAVRDADAKAEPAARDLVHDRRRCARNPRRCGRRSARSRCRTGCARWRAPAPCTAPCCRTGSGCRCRRNRAARSRARCRGSAPPSGTATRQMAGRVSGIRSPPGKADARRHAMDTQRSRRLLAAKRHRFLRQRANEVLFSFSAVFILRKSTGSRRGRLWNAPSRPSA